MNGSCNQGHLVSLFPGWNYKMYLTLHIPIVLWENFLWISVHILKFERSQDKCHFDTAKRNTLLKIYLVSWEPRYWGRCKQLLAKGFLESVSITHNEKIPKQNLIYRKKELFIPFMYNSSSYELTCNFSLPTSSVFIFYTNTHFLPVVFVCSKMMYYLSITNPYLFIPLMCDHENTFQSFFSKEYRREEEDTI